ncbi:MAG TPA: protein kinase [Gemmatirosa sp.]
MSAPLPVALRDQLQSALGTTYTLERELGGGGMSRVFVARDEALGRDVVVKVLAPELAAELSAERFAREIRLVAALQEPHIVPVLAAGVTANGLQYYTMPFVRGASLRQRLAGGRVPFTEAVGILRDVARALAHAHDRGVVHRDIKPENVLLSERTAVVTDFGIAKAIAVSSTHADGAAVVDQPGGTLTGVGVSLGTPAYMSPEQVAGDTVDQRTDTYAWGVVAYEVLSGRHPFVDQGSAQRLLVAQLTELPSSTPLHRARVPDALTELVMRCLAKDRAQRPSGGTELLATLDTSASLAGRRWLALGGPRRRAPALLLAAGIAALLAVGARVRAARSVGTDEIHSVAVLPFENIGGDSADAYLAHGITNELAVTLGRLPDIRVAPGVSARVLQARGLTATDIARTLDVQGVLSGTVRRGGDRLRVSAEMIAARSGERVWADQFEADRADVFAVEDQVTRAIVGALRPRLIGRGAPPVAPGRGTADPAAYDLYLRGRYFWSLRSEEGMRRAIDYFGRAAGQDSDYVLAISGLADAYAVSAWYSYVPPVEGYGRARELARRALRLDSTRAEPHASLGYVALYYDWDRVEAQRQFERAIALDSTYATAYQWYGNFLVASNRPDEAIAAFRRAQRADPLNRVTVGAGCWGMLMVRRYRDALAQCGQVLELDSTFAVARLWRGQALDMLGDTAAAVRELELATRLSARSAVSVAALAHAYARAGQAPRARTLLAELTSGRRKYVPSYEVALVHVALGEPEQALTWLERAYRERSHSIAFLGVDAALDPLRHDARFVALLERAGLR